MPKYRIKAVATLSSSSLNNMIAIGIGAIYPDVARFTRSADWLECNGQAVLRQEYPELFAIIGTCFGKGDDLSTFNIPDLRGTGHQ